MNEVISHEYASMRRKTLREQGAREHGYQMMFVMKIFVPRA